MGILVVALALPTIGCGSDDPADDAPSDFYLGPEQVFTGFDGVATFRVPLVTNLPGPIVWTVTDPAIATVAEVDPPDELGGTDEVWAMITTTAPGFSTITASAAGTTLAVGVDVSGYDPAVTALGAQRYNDPAQPGATRQACASCHLKPDGADHTASEMAPYADDEILTVIRTGTYYDGEKLAIEHAWNLTDDEAAGIVPYLRSLAPRGF